MIHWPYGRCRTWSNSQWCSCWHNAWCYTYALYPGTMSGWGANWTDLRSRSSSVSSGNILGLGQSWPPGRWRQIPPSLVVVHLFDLWWDCRYCEFPISKQPSSSDFGRWIHWCSFSWGNSSLHLFWALNSWIRDVRHLWVREGWNLPLYVALRYRFSSFIFGSNLSDALGPRSNL